VRPSAARSRMRVRIHRMPSGSRPFTGSSNSRTAGSPSNAAAMPRRWLMPSENRPARRRATASSPTSPSTSSTRRLWMPLLWARQSRWWYAVRPPCTARASSRAPTSRMGTGSSAYRRPRTVTVPLVGASRPRIMRMVVVLPAPLGPRKPVTRPGVTVQVRSSTATARPKCLVNPRSSIMPPMVAREDGPLRKGPVRFLGADPGCAGGPPGTHRNISAPTRRAATIGRRRSTGPSARPPLALLPCRKHVDLAAGPPAACPGKAEQSPLATPHLGRPCGSGLSRGAGSGGRGTRRAPARRRPQRCPREHAVRR
jgi:hypothetical protein